MPRSLAKTKPAPANDSSGDLARSPFAAWVLAVALVLLSVALYWPTTHNGFVNLDDPVYVTANPYVQGGLSWESFKWAWVNTVCCNWHPVTVLSHTLDCQLFDLKPWGPHLINLLLHALNAGLVFALLHVMTGARWRSLLVAALFALHPLRVESVAWVAERKDVLSSFFGLLALLAYARYVAGIREKAESRKQKAEKGNAPHVSCSTLHAPRSTLPVSAFYLLSLLLFALGLMSKPTLVTWPFVMLLLDYWPLGRMQGAMQKEEGRRNKQGTSDTEPSSRCPLHASRYGPLLRLLIEKLPFLALSALSCLATIIVQRGAMTAMDSLPLGARVENALVSYGRYVGKLFWPTDLAAWYPHPAHWPLPAVVLAGVAILLVTALVWMRRTRWPYLLVGWLWFLGTLVPMIGLVQVGAQAMADRYTYLPSLGLLILVVWAGDDLTSRWPHRLAALSLAGGAALVLCLVLTSRQIGYWKESETLFRHALAVTANNYLAHNLLGSALDEKGQTEEALRHYEEALRLNPQFASARNNLGVALGERGQIDEAISQIEESLRLNADDGNFHYNLGVALTRKGQTDQAIHQFQEAIRLRPSHAMAHNDLGTALGGKGQLEEAVGQFRQAIRLKPNCAEAHCNLGVSVLGQGKVDEAIRHFEDAIRLNPAAALAHRHLARALNQKGQIDQAIRQYQEVVRLEPNDVNTHYSLGSLLFRKGQMDEAIRQFQEALRLKPDYAKAHNNLGAAFYRQDRADEAIRQFQEALRLQPDFAEARRNLDAVLAVRARFSPLPGAVTNR